jgi:hypothetical protein
VLPAEPVRAERRGAVADVEIIQNAGGVLAFVEEDIDPTGPFGDFILKVCSRSPSSS